MAKDKVKNSIENFIERTTSGNASADELSALPRVLSVYCEFYRDKMTHDVDTAEPPSNVMVSELVLPQFPAEGLVGVKQVASFLSLSENTVWQKLRTDADFPKPRVRESRRTRWDASQIREYRQRTEII
jgi:predicted DNA-binding transcriptional regulator AlpA